MTEEIIHYHFEELIKTIVTLSQTAEKQMYIMGFGHVGDEMVIDFEAHFSDHISIYLETGLITLEHFKYLNDYNDYLDRKLEGQTAKFFIDRQELMTNSIWEEIRLESKKLLKLLDRADLDIEVFREVHGNIEWTKTKLINKNNKHNT
ncbi:hypothetical protein D3C76_1462100 [compost metagenome]